MGIGTVVGYLNRPDVKMVIKYFVGCLQLYKTEEEVIKPLPTGTEYWLSIVERTAMVGQVLTSSPVQQIIGRYIDYFLNPDLLVTWFGPNIHFAGNPTHPRHLISIVSAIALLAAAILRACKDLDQNNPALFSFVVSRPTLHVVNALGKQLVASFHILVPV